MSFVIGLTGGIFGSLIGLGGGVVIIPLLTRVFYLSQHQAHGTSLVALIFTGLVGSAPYLWKHHTDIPSAVILAVFAMATARLGAKYCHHLPELRLKRYFGLFLMAMAVLIVVKSYVNPAANPVTGLGKWAILSAVGLLTGFLSGLMGVGGGAILITGLVLFLGYDQHLAQGTSLLAMIPGSAVGGWIHWKSGLVATDHLTGLISGIILGAMSGGTLAQHIPGMWLRTIFSVILIWLGYRYIKSSFSQEEITNEDSRCRF